MQAKADLPCAHAGCRQWVVCRCTAACHNGSCTCKRAVQASSHDSAQFRSCLTVLHVFGAADSQLRGTHHACAAHNSTCWLLRSRLAAWSHTCGQHAALALSEGTNWEPCPCAASAHSLTMWPTLSVFCSVRQHTPKHGRKMLSTKQGAGQPLPPRLFYWQRQPQQGATCGYGAVYGSWWGARDGASTLLGKGRT